MIAERSDSAIIRKMEKTCPLSACQIVPECLDFLNAMPRTGNALSEQGLLENLEACLPMHYPRFLKFDQPLQAMIPWMHQLYKSWWPASEASSLVRSCADLNFDATGRYTHYDNLTFGCNLFCTWMHLNSISYSN